jgi:hypothetical protein
MDLWDRKASDSDGQYKREDFEVAAYRLLTEQALYYSDVRSRNSYRLVDIYEDDFRNTLELLGVELRLNRELRFAVAISRHAKISHNSIEETLFALLLRKIQDEGLQRGEMTEEGEIHCELTTLSERYEQETRRSFPERGRLTAILRALRRYGIVRLLDGDTEASVGSELDQPYTIAIRPALPDILGAGALERLAQWKPNDSQPLPVAETTEETGAQ